MNNKDMMNVFANMEAAVGFYNKGFDPKEVVMRHAQKVIEVFPASSEVTRYAEDLLKHFMCL